MLENLFSPIKIGNMELKNRISFAPMASNLNDPEGYITEDYIRYMEARAKGGYGLICEGQTIVTPLGKGHPLQACIWDDKYVDGLKELVDRVHAAGAKIAIQLHHCGRMAKPALTGGVLKAPSPIRATYGQVTPEEMTLEEIEELKEEFGQAARRAKEAGFDMVIEHVVADYLLASFMSPMSNKRTDQYGGSLENRARLVLEVFRKYREVLGPDFPIGVRLLVDQVQPAGLSLADGFTIIRMLEAEGADYFDVSRGIFAYPDGAKAVPSYYVGHAPTMDLGIMCKKAVSKPIGIAGRISTANIADTLIASGCTDIVTVGRPGLADPEWPNKAREGRFDDIISCIACLQGCTGENTFGRKMSCVCNPMTGYEAIYDLSEVSESEKKQVMVVGGGIAGMEAAIAAATRGHKVSLYEKSDRLGGQWLLAAIPPCKTEHNTLTIWQKNQLKKLGVDIHMNTEVTDELIDEVKPDSIIIATGVRPTTPPIPGVDLPHVKQAFDVLSLKENGWGGNTVVIGGGPVGCDVAAHVAFHTVALGGKVTVLEMLPAISPGTFLTNDWMFDEMKQLKVDLVTSASVKKITEDSVEYEKDGQQHVIEKVSMVILATGAKSNADLAKKLEEKGIACVVVGDAVSPRKATQAVREGFEAGLKV